MNHVTLTSRHVIEKSSHVDLRLSTLYLSVTKDPHNKTSLRIRGLSHRAGDRSPLSVCVQVSKKHIISTSSPQQRWTIQPQIAKVQISNPVFFTYIYCASVFSFLKRLQRVFFVQMT